MKRREFIGLLAGVVLAAPSVKAMVERDAAENITAGTQINKNPMRMNPKGYPIKYDVFSADGKLKGHVTENGFAPPNTVTGDLIAPHRAFTTPNDYI